MFPRALPRHVFVIFSARETANRDWLATLCLEEATVETLSLRPLDIDPVRRLLESGGAATRALACDATFVAKMHEKSGGDPFYLQYLARDIASRRIATVDQLEQQPSGLGAYLDRWWEEASAAVGDLAVRDLLGYLLVAKGRLRRADLIAISDGDSLDAWVFDQAIKRVERYVIGDERSGYALTHPRFQEYRRLVFARELGPRGCPHTAALD